MSQFNFTFSDTIAGYVTAYDNKKNAFGLRTTDGREFTVNLTNATYAELIRNLDEPYVDCTGQIRDMLVPGFYLFAYGSFYPEGNAGVFEAKHLVFPGKTEGEFCFEKPDWWIKQIRSLANFYLNAQFPDGNIDFANYRTQINLYGEKLDGTRQETDTISRLVYGFATAFMLTGDERFLEAAEKGTAYLREHLRAVDETEDICYWYHAMDVANGKPRKIRSSNLGDVSGFRSHHTAEQGRKERKILASEFSDDYDAIPMYEQIYALAGPTQTFRVTGDPAILQDIERTINLFNRYFRDRDRGGFFSHIDPVSFSPYSETLGKDRARKNWNSVGDHAPAYLINLYLATGDERWAEMLVETADTIVERFPDYKNSPFVQERFFEDWSPDQEWGWQQNRAVVGHNLKIAWNLMRIYNINQDERYVELARKIADVMPTVGCDLQRGGWYDVMERSRSKGQNAHRFVWHDRKAWWQQEQAILAYLILAGSVKAPEYLQFARESSAFYNAWFLDHDSGAVYFNVLANGLPYLLGNERNKGSHSMSGYHSFELSFLAAVYTNLLVTRQPMNFYFKPKPGAFKDNTLRIQPDLLPAGCLRIEEVWVNGERYSNFDPKNMSIQLPSTNEPVTVQVRVAPTLGVEHFRALTDVQNGTTRLILQGELDSRAVPHFRTLIESTAERGSKKLVIEAQDLSSLTTAGARAFSFARQKLPVDTQIFVVGANDNIIQVLEQEEIVDELNFVDEYIPEPARPAGRQTSGSRR